MKIRVGKRCFAIAMSVVLLIGLMGGSALANSAQTNWKGVSATGAVVTDKDCPIEVEKEVLTFDLQEFPESYYREEAAYLAYSGKVTAEYTFYNPADYEVTATLLFPFGKEPDYAYFSEEEANIDTEKYDITIDGRAIAKTMRYSYSDRWEKFHLEQDLVRLSNEYREDAFYSPELKVWKYTYRVEGSEEAQAPTVAVDMRTDDDARKVYFVEQSGFYSQEDKTMRLSHWVVPGGSLTLYALGKPFDEVPEWTFYQDGGVEDGEEIKGAVTYLGVEEMTFREMALTKWSKEQGVSEIDWYNGILAKFLEMNGSILHAWDIGLDLTNQLMRWYEYEITIGPGERIVNTVTAPIYPAIDADYEPPVYEYTYLLSPAQTWKSFGELEIIVNTPYYVIESNTDGFVKTDTGYRLQREGLPEEELVFSLSASEKPKVIRNWSGIMWFILALVLQMAPILLVGVILVIALKLKKGQKR